MSFAGKTRSDWKSPNFSSLVPSMNSPMFDRVVLLDEWWLIKPDSDTLLRVGGISQQNKTIRSFVTAEIVKREDAVTLKTVDGITVVLNGLLNKSRTLENGFSRKVCEHFICGFPYDWEEYDALSFDKHEKPSTEDDGCIKMQKLFDNILKHGSDLPKCSKNETSPQIRPIVHTPDEITANKRHKSDADSVKRSGPLTRSRAQVQDNAE